MALTRTQEEIAARVEDRKPADMLGFEWQEYAVYLDAEHIRPYLGDPEQSWEPTVDDPTERMESYMDFAWDKANNERGISANRSIMHYIAWLWLAGENDLLERVQDAYHNNYHRYGKPILRMICEHFGWDWHRWGDG